MEANKKQTNPLHSLEVWKRATSINVTFLPILYNIKLFGLRDQITRSFLSIPSNIAEGFGRYSDKDFIRFLRIALGSALEAETQLYIAIEAGFLSRDSEKLYQELKVLRIMIYKLIKSIEKRLTN